ncbi:MAG: C-terminal binding protein [Acidobacteriia bacterium]|nr:C-terminal binding protein [Terriglobia bacterium]
MSTTSPAVRSPDKFLVVHTDPDLHPLDSLMRAQLEDLGARIVHFAGTADKFLEEAADADAILNADFLITAPIIGALRRCRVISRFGIGVDNIDVAAATARGIPVANVPDFCAEEVANRAFTLLLACACQLVQLDHNVRAGAWRGGAVPETVQIEGQILGLVGFGRIARAVARRGQAFGMKVIAHDPYLTPSAIEQEGASPATFEEVLSKSDFLSLHAPLTPQTRHLISAETLRLVKPSAVLINTARGGLIDEQALVQALREQRLARAGLEVLEREPPLKDNPLLSMDRVVFTPHSAAHTRKALERVREAAVDAVVRVLRGERPLHIVNPSVLPG